MALSQHDVLPDSWVRCPDCRMHARVGNGIASGQERARCGQCGRGHGQRYIDRVAPDGRVMHLVQIFVDRAEVKARKWELAERPRLLTDEEG